MNLETFFEQFKLLTDAPNAVPKLRELILQLAVQGKLVPQDSNDEPALRLLEKLRTSKKPINVRKGKNLDFFSSIDLNNLPFKVPESWQWARFQEVATIASNLVKPELYLDFPHVAPDNIEKQTGKLLSYRTVKEDEVRSSNHRFFSGQILYSKIRPNLAKVTIVDFDGLCSADMYPINAYIDSKFLLRYMLSSTFLSMSVKSDTRVAMPKINQEELNKILVPVPPLHEQKRIVAKVDRLMKLCDELEERQQERRSHNRRLNEGAIAQLLTTTTPDDFTHHWQRICNNFDLLYSLPENITQLRQAILQLAVDGKLSLQNQQNEANTDWQKVYLKELCQTIQTGPFGSLLHASDYVVNGIPLVNPQNMKGNIITPSAGKAVSKTTKQRLRANL